VANVTIAIDDEVLRRARVKAAEHATSVNAVVREALELFVSVDERKRAIDEFLRFVGENPGHGAGWKWNREELYDERMSRDGRQSVPRH
jgi:plasmid stability protein